MNILGAIAAALVGLFALHLTFATETTNKCAGYSLIVKSPIGNGKANNLRINDGVQVTIYPNCTASITSSFTIARPFINASCAYDVMKVLFTPITVYGEKNVNLSEIITRAGYDIEYPIANAGEYTGDSTKLVDFSQYTDYLPLACGEAVIKGYVNYDGLTKTPDIFTINVVVKKA